MLKKITIRYLLLFIFIQSSPLLAKNIQYVSDDLTIPMRSGTTTAHKILKFLNSGVAVEIIELTDDEQYALVVLVDDDSKTGWIETRLLMVEKSARVQLELIRVKNQSIREKQAVIKKQLAEVQRQNNELQNIQSQLETKIKTLQKTLSRLRKNAADPVRIADENDQLKQQLSNVETKLEDLAQENIILSDKNIKQWFMIGAMVSLGSLVLGVILTRIRWTKKESWGGDY